LRESTGDQCPIPKDRRLDKGPCKNPSDSAKICEKRWL